MTEDVYEKVKTEIPKDIGVLVKCGSKVSSVKKSSRKELPVNERILKDSFIRSTFREASKYYNLEDEDTIKKLKRQLSYQKSLYNQYYEKYWYLLRQIEEKYGTDWDRGVK